MKANVTYSHFNTHYTHPTSWWQKCTYFSCFFIIIIIFFFISVFCSLNATNAQYATMMHHVLDLPLPRLPDLISWQNQRFYKRFYCWFSRETAMNPMLNFHQFSRQFFSHLMFLTFSGLLLHYFLSLGKNICLPDESTG